MLLSQAYLYNPHGYESDSSSPNPLIEDIDDPLRLTNERTNEQTHPFLTLRAIRARGE